MIISNSEVEAFNMCERSHYYKFGLGLRPKIEDLAIQIGVMGHFLLESYYRQGLETSDRKVWYEAAVSTLQDLIGNAETEDQLSIIALVQTRFHQYLNFYSDDSWRIVDVEGSYSIGLTDDIVYGFTLDLLIEETQGISRGQFIVLDHKWSYRFNTADEIRMNAQIPKYVYGLQKLGFPVRFGMLNEIRSRTDIKDVSKLFNRALIRPTPARMENLIKEQLRASELIAANLNKPVAAYNESARRNVSKQSCGTCRFRLPCSMSLDNRFDQESRMLAIDYVENSYGYR